MKQSIYETVTNTILDALRRGVVPWRRPWNGEGAAPMNAITHRPYRGVNTLLLALRPYTDHRWLTLRQVSERGGRVKAGERATLVVFWKQWQPPPNADEEERSKKRPIPLLRYFHVFNVEQCDGLGLPEVHRPAGHEHQRIERADMMARSMPNPPRVREGGLPPENEDALS